MAVTEKTYTSDGSTSYTFPFEYLKTTDVKVTVDGTAETNFTVPNGAPTTVQFNSGHIPASGKAIRIYRDTNVDNLSATFYAGSAIKSQDLNDNFNQNLYVTQEAKRDAASAWQDGDETIHSTETWHTSDETKVATTKAIESRIDAKIDTALTTDVSGGDGITIVDNNPATGQIRVDLDADIATLKDMQSGAATKLAALTSTELAILDGATVTKDELNILDGVTATKDEINILDGVTATKDEINILDGVTATKDEINILDGVTATKDEINILDGVTATKDEINILDGVTATKDEIKILDGVTATKDEINILDGVTATKDEINILDGVTATKDEINILDGVTATKDEINILDGVTATKDELNILDGVTATKDELNKTDGLLATTEELNTLDGVTSNTSELNKLDGYTGSTNDLNIVSGKSFKTSSGTLDTTSDTEIPSSKVIAAHVASSQTAIGGFITIADEVSFPTTANMPANGVVVSINNAAGVVINGSGVSTTGRTTDGTPATVTINNFPSSLNGETLAAGVGLMVTATSTANTYNYHKILAAETDVKQLSDDINDFNARYRVAGSAPSSNNDDGDLYFDTAANKMKVYNGTTSAWDDVASVGNFYINTISSSSGTGGGSATFNGSAYRFTLSNPPTMAQQLIVSVNGVIQKPNAGTSQPSEGFAISGNDIIFSAAPASGADYFIVTQGSSVSIGTPSDNTVTSAKIVDGSIVNGDISSSANIAGSKVADDSIPEVKLDIHNAPATDKYLKYTSNGMEWSDGASEGTDVKSTGESGTAKFLRVDGDGTCSWQVPPDTNTQVGGATGVDFNDDVKARFGTGNDLELYDSGTSSYIQDNGTGDLIIRASDQLKIQETDGGETMAVFNKDGAVELYENNTKRLETTSTGINVTGAINVNGTALSAAPEVTMTADGAIAANTAVIVKPDGDVKSVTGVAESISSETTGPATTIRNSYADNAHFLSTAFDPDNNKVLAVWEEDRSDNHIYGSIGTINQTNNTISWTSKTSLFSWDGNHRDNLKVCCVGSNRYVMAYRRGSNRGYASAINVSSSNAISLVSEQQMHPFSYAITMVDICKIGTNKWASVYNPSQYAAQAAFTGVHNGSSSMTMDGEISLYDGGSNNQYGNDPRICYIPSLNKCAIAWHFVVGNGKIQACLIKDASDGNWSMSSDRGDILDLETNTTSQSLQDPFPLWDEKNQKLLIIYAGNGAKPVVRICSISGNDITMESSAQLSITGGTSAYATDQMYGAIDDTTGQAVVVMRNEADANKPYYVGFKLNATKDGIVQNTNSTWLAASGTNISALGDRPEVDVELIGDSKFLFTYLPDTTGGNANTNKYITSRFKIYPSTDLTTENFIGFSGDAISDNASGTIKVTGNTTTQSSLTPGQKYYVQDDGTLGTSPGLVTAEAGIALSSTKLLIKG